MAKVRKSGGEYPPEIIKLIAKHGGVAKYAEAAAGISAGTFFKIRAGVRDFSEQTHAKVMQALSTKGTEPVQRTYAPTPATIPDSCPPILAELLELKGTKKGAIEFLGTTDGQLAAVMTGAREMSPEWIVKIKAALGRPIIGAELGTAAPLPPIPEFVPWNGKTVSVKVMGAPGKPAMVVKGVPEPVAKLIDKYKGVVTHAAGSIGRTAAVIRNILDKKRKFDDKMQRMVHNALHDRPPEEQKTITEDFDKYELGIAIVLVAANNFDRVNDVADILQARPVFKKNTKIGWLIIYKMATGDLPKFKKLSFRDANEIVCP